MAYEVTKRVGERAYRYRVESYRDPASTKVRSRWTYLGVVASDGSAPAPAKRAGAERTRERLLEAFETLAREQSFRDVTAGAVANKAGVAHGTFYRHFPDKRALLLASIERVRRQLDATRPDFVSPIGTREEERARVRDWLAAVFSRKGHNVGLFRAFMEAADLDEELRAFRTSRKAERVASLSTYFERLTEAKISAIDHPEALAGALTLMVDGVMRDWLASYDIAEEEKPAALATGIIDAFDRAIFAER